MLIMLMAAIENWSAVSTERPVLYTLEALGVSFTRPVFLLCHTTGSSISWQSYQNKRCLLVTPS
jgi:hypothetical protein